MKGKAVRILAGLCLAGLLGACGAAPAVDDAVTSPAAEIAVPTETGRPDAAPTGSDTDQTPESNDTTQEDKHMLHMALGETDVCVNWEDNESVAALRELCRTQPLSVSLSMYGGFEQVGPIGTALPRNDVQTTTAPGDIVLYAGDQIVVFYGSNSWAYTRLGRIADKSASALTALLGRGDVTLTFSLDEE